MRAPASFVCLVAALALLVPDAAQAGRPRPNHEEPGHLTFTSPQANPLALSPDGSLLLVANTSSNTVDVINTATNTRSAIVTVGLEPVSVAFRPDGLEAWVANHVSDSISVIDTNPGSASYLKVVETIHSLDANGSTLFDEPVGIAFSSNTKAYVALSSRNQIARIDAVNYAVLSPNIFISAQDPRAIAFRNNRLYVAAFESGNQSELSVCGTESSTNPQCTLSGNTLSGNDLLTFAQNPNIPGEQKNIVIDLQVPDRDLFVIDTTTDAVIKTQVGVGTLLYGVAVDSADRVYVTQTDARNAVNGITFPAGSRTDPNGDGDINLADLDNRMFLNEVAILNCAGGGSTCTPVSTIDLDPGFPSPANALATPFGVAVSGDNATVVGTAAGTNRVFAMNADGTGLTILSVGAIPKGVALRSNAGTGDAEKAYVLNSLANTVTVVNVTHAPPAAPVLSFAATITVGADATPAAVRLGNIAFNNAFASDSGTFSCASCHPDGNTDQVLWRIGGECFLGGCVADEDEPRSTMPIRGLRDTVPLHWDGTLGDPFGGGNGAVGSGGSGGTNCTVGNQHGCFRQLVDGSLSAVMCDQTPSCAVGPSGLPGRLGNTEREDMATFLARVSYPPARSRRMNDSASSSAVLGFEDFFMDQGGIAGQPDTCADSDAGCHELPLGTGTNSETLNGFEVPTMRGLTDRFLQFSIGPTNAEEILVVANAGFTGIPLTIAPLEGSIAWDPAGKGHQEITTFGAAFGIFEPIYGPRPLDMFQMFEEASTGHSGSLGRQVSLNTRTTNGGLAAGTDAQLQRLEAADERGVVNLRGHGLRLGSPVTLSYVQASDLYIPGNLTHAQLLAEAANGTTIITLTAFPRSGVNEDVSQPLLAPIGAQCDAGTGPTGDPALPSGSTIQLEGAHVSASDTVFLNGQPTSATITLLGVSSSCLPTQGQITTQLLQISGLSLGGGTDLLQVRSAAGLLSNEMPIP